MTSDLNAFYKPDSVAIIGASSNPNKLSFGILRNLVEGPYAGKVFPVNPGSTDILGVRTYKSITDIQEKVELVVIALPAQFIPEVLVACGQKGSRAAVIISGGFKEIGPEGAELESRCADIGRKFKMRLIGPNCVGTMDMYSGLNTTFIKGTPEIGHIGFVSQSGAVCGAVVDYVQDLGVGFSSMASLGNEIDVNETDIIEYLWKDDHTHVICAYIESIQDGTRFMEVANQVSRDKPIVMLKAGRSGAGAQAVSSHTGSIAGSYDAYLAAFKQSGIIPVDTLHELIHISQGFALQPLPKGPRTIIMTNSGGPAALAADNLEHNNLSLPLLPQAIQNQLAKVLPANSQVMNPIDMLGGADENNYADALNMVQADHDIDNAIVIHTPQALIDPSSIAEAIVESTKDHKITVISSFVGGKSIPAARKYLHAHNIPLYDSPELPPKVLGAMLKYRRTLERNPQNADEIIRFDKKSASSQMELLTNHKIVGESGTRPILQAYSIPVIPGGTASNRSEALSIAEQVTYPVVLKIAAEDVFHKSDIGGVMLNLKNSAELSTAYNKMESIYQENHPDPEKFKVIVEKMAPQGNEMIIGVKRDPTFGPLIMLGMGGTLVELIKDVTFRIAPVSLELAHEMINELKTGILLNGYRGSEPADVDTLARVIVSLGTMAVDFPGILEIEINPLVILKKGEGVYALDARMILS